MSVPLGRATCIDCNRESERLLPARFPHICSRCLFPPARPDSRELVQALVERTKRRNRVAA
jgi:hypothetical protein